MRLWLPLVALSFACNTTPETPSSPETPDAVAKVDAEPDAQIVAMFKPLPADMATADRPVTKERVELGKMLYFDKRLSKNHDIACNSCHMLDKYGVDNEPTSPGHKAQRGGRNSPTVYNAALHMTQFWDGRAADVEEQAKGPVVNAVEMAMPDLDTCTNVLKTIPGYEAPFKAAFPDAEDPVNYDNAAIAIGAFERTLVTPGRFDAYLKGDGSALTAEEVEGAKVFINTGCTTCHMGVGVGGNMYQKIGLVEPYPTEDVGRKEVTGNDSDAFMFKVPSLRNIAKTGPYFHDGQVKTLDEATKLMAKHQLGKELSDEDTKKIVTFLEALTGEIPEGVATPPELPESGPDTPKPDPS